MEKSFSEQGLRIFFVRQSKTPPSSFTEAFESCQEKLIGPKMMTEKECEALKLDRKVVLVLETFQGPLFKQLDKAPCAVLGAPCVLECLRKGEPTPDGPHPVFSLAMQGLRVCVSGFTAAQKEDLAEKVRFMGATFEKNLHSEVTHLVVTRTNTDKYHLAASRKIPVMLESWVHESWDSNQTEHKSALQEPLCSLKCLPFQGLTVTVTQFHKSKKDRLKAIIEQNGGTYCPALTCGETDALVVANSSGQKFQFAKQWNIPCVTEAWIYDSAKAGYSLPTPDYAVKPATKTSTPDRESMQMSLDISTISTVLGDPRRSHVDETMMTSFAEPLPPERRQEPPATPEKEPDASSVLLKMTVAEVRRAGQFLDGCKVYVSGGTSALQDKLRKILNSSGATRFDDVSESLTHILLAGQSLRPPEAKELAKLGRRPPVVPLSWLLKSIEQKHPAEATGPEGTEPPSPLSKRGMQMFAEPAPKPTFSPRTAKRDLAVVQQYLDQEAGPSALPEAPSAREQEGEAEEELATPLAASSNLRVQLLGLSKSEAAEARLTVQHLGGQIVFGGADVVVGPYHADDPAPNQVNLYWLQDCAEQQEVVPHVYYHRPIVKKPQKPLKDTVIAISNYGGKERTYLSNLAAELGALYQDVFAKKAAANRGAVASTHLVCPNPEGSKFNAAKKWNLPAVTKEWLLECAEKNARVPEEPYLLNPRATGRASMAAPSPSASIVAPSPSASVLSSSITSNRDSIATVTPIRTPGSSSMDIETPMRPPPTVAAFATPFTPRHGSPTDKDKVLKEEAARICRLSLPSFNKAINQLSPNYLSTPETPYGSVVKDDPSPATRKMWKRYLNSIPETNKFGPPADGIEKEKINKRLRIEELDENEDDEENVRKRRKDAVEEPELDDDELLKDYSSQKASKRAESPADQEKENHVAGPSSSLNNPPQPEAERPSLPANERVFMVTGFKDMDTENLQTLVQNLGARFSSGKMFDPAATHLVTPLPTRSEKLLASMAAGLWVVHSQYLLQSTKAGHFLPEENFEWGNEAAADLLEPLLEDNPRGRDLAAACLKWRHQAATKGAAFADFKVMLVGPPSKSAAFERMIIAGGGQVVPFEGELEGVTHCIVNANRMNVDLSRVKEAGIPCYLPIFLNDFLIGDQTAKGTNHRI